MGGQRGKRKASQDMRHDFDVWPRGMALCLDPQTMIGRLLRSSNRLPCGLVEDMPMWPSISPSTPLSMSFPHPIAAAIAPFHGLISACILICAVEAGAGATREVLLPHCLISCIEWATSIDSPRSTGQVPMSWLARSLRSVTVGWPARLMILVSCAGSMTTGSRRRDPGSPA